MDVFMHVYLRIFPKKMDLILLLSYSNTDRLIEATLQDKTKGWLPRLSLMLKE